MSLDINWDHSLESVEVTMTDASGFDSDTNTDVSSVEVLVFGF